MKTNNEIIFISNRIIKSMNDDTGEIGSHSIVFGDKGNKDFHGNWFTKNTFLGHNREDGATDVGLLNHRVPLFRKNQFDPATEKSLKEIADMRFKNPVTSKVDGIGEFSSLVLDLSDKYEKMVYELAKKGVFKWSSGTAPQTYKALPTGELEMFVVVEKSLTPIPAEYRMLEHRVMPLKAYTDFMEKEDQTNIGKSSLSKFFAGYSAIKNFEIAMEETVKGGKGSRNFGHKGRPGKIGGSGDDMNSSTSSSDNIQQAFDDFDDEEKKWRHMFPKGATEAVGVRVKMTSTKTGTLVRREKVFRNTAEFHDWYKQNEIQEIVHVYTENNDGTPLKFGK